MKDEQLLTWLRDLKLSYIREQHQALAREATEKNWTPLDFLGRLIEGEVLRRKDHATQRRLKAARFPLIKVLQQFDWTWPIKINRTQVQNLFRLTFLKDKANVIFMGGAGLGNDCSRSGEGRGGACAPASERNPLDKPLAPRPTRQTRMASPILNLSPPSTVSAWTATWPA